MARETLETGYIETKSENIKTELKKLEESEPDSLPSYISKNNSSESSTESKPQDSSSEKANLLHRVVSLLMKSHKVQIQRV